MTGLMTSAQVAALLAVSRRTVLRLAECGELPGLRVGSQWRFREQSITDWQAARETGNPPQQRQTSAPAAASVARPVLTPLGALPEGYTPVFGHLGATTSLAAPSAAGRARGTRTRKSAG